MLHAGGCLCGSVSFEVDRSYLSAVNCYCGMCRRAHGGAYSTHVPMRRDQFKLVSGELETFASSSEGIREFCRRCGAHVLVHGQTSDNSIAVPAGLFAKDTPVSTTAHIFVKDKVAWHTINDDLPQHEAWPPGVVATYKED
jgi:hypothetical protein